MKAAGERSGALSHPSISLSLTRRAGAERARGRGAVATDEVLLWGCGNGCRGSERGRGMSERAERAASERAAALLGRNEKRKDSPPWPPCWRSARSARGASSAAASAAAAFPVPVRGFRGGRGEEGGGGREHKNTNSRAPVAPALSARDARGAQPTLCPRAPRPFLTIAFSPPPSEATRRAYACCAAMSTDASNGMASVAMARRARSSKPQERERDPFSFQQHARARSRGRGRAEGEPGRGRSIGRA